MISRRRNHKVAVRLRARQLMDQLKDGKSPYHFIEVMGCPEAVSWAADSRAGRPDVRSKRLSGLYAEDEGKTLRKSHETRLSQSFTRSTLSTPTATRPTSPPYPLCGKGRVQRALLREVLQALQKRSRARAARTPPTSLTPTGRTAGVCARSWSRQGAHARGRQYKA